MIGLSLLLSVVTLQPGLYPILYQPSSQVYVKFYDVFTQTGINAADGINNALRVNIVASSISAGGGTSSTFGGTFPVTGTAAGFIGSTGLMAGANLTAAGNLKVDCQSGCTAGGSFADNSAFTFNTTAISNTGFVVDDVASNTVAENSAGAGRMSTNRIPYFSLHSDAGTAITTLPVSLAANVPVTQVTSPWVISGAVTNTPPTNQSINLNQIIGTAPDVNSGLKSAGTLRVVLATDQVQLTNKLLVTPDSVALPANQSTNVNQFGGNNVVTGTGTSGVGIPRVTISNDSTLAANQSVNVAQFGGTNIVTGTGASGVGIPRVTISNDSSFAANQSTNLAQIAGSAVVTAAAGVVKVGIVGNANGAFDAANNAAAPANVIVDGFETATQTTTQPTAATAGNVRRGVISTDGSLYVRPHGPVIWSCGLSNIGTTLTQCQAAPGASLKLYITNIIAQSNTATAGLYTVRFGTGANCVTGTGNLFFASATALIAAPANTAPPTVIQMVTPIAVTANNAICVLGVVTNTTNIQINGYSAP